MEYALKKLSEIIGSRDLAELGRTLVGAAEKLAHGTPTLVLALDQSGLTPYPSPGFPAQLVDRFREIILKERYLSRLQSGDPLEVPAREWNGPLPQEVKRVALSPLALHGRQFGVMVFLEITRVSTRDRRAIRLLSDAACLAADSVTSAGLVKTRLYKMSLLQEITQRMTVSLDLEEIGLAGADGALKLSGADGARIWTASQRGTPKRLAAAGQVWDGPEAGEDWDWRKPRRALRRRLKENRPAVVNDARARVDDSLAPLVGPFLSWAAFPLVPYETPIGIMELFCKRPFGFPADDQLLLGILAEAIAFTMQNAMLYARISEQKDQITQMKEYVEGIIRDIHEGIIVVDEVDRIRLINPEARKLGGSRARRGADFKTALPQTLAEKMIELRSAPAARDSVVEFDLDRAENGEPPLPVGLRFTALKGPESGGDFMFVVQDLSWLREIQTLRELDRLKSQFISAVGHELRTPLTSIQGFISTLRQAQEHEFDFATRSEFYGIIEAECLSLTRLIDNLLHVSRIDAGETLAMNIKPFDLGAMLRRMVQSRKPPSDKRSIEISAPPGLEPLEADESLIEHVAANLFTNALKYSPPKSRVALEVEDLGDRVKVSVVDDGPGIPPEERKKVFRQFYRIRNATTAAKGGAGVGLFLSRYLIRMHGGEIDVTASDQGGSRFFFILPKKQTTA